MLGSVARPRFPLAFILLALLIPAAPAPAASHPTAPRAVVRKMHDAPKVKIQRRARASVVGGARTPIQQAPWAVHLLLYDANDNLAGSCSGSIIDPNRIVTAEHCFRDEATNAPVIDGASIVAGSSRFDPATGAPIAQPGDAPQVVEATLRHYPASYTRAARNQWYNDLAVVTLARPLDLSGPSARAIPVIEPGPVYYGTVGTLAGFGLQDGYRRTLDGSLYSMTQTIVPYPEGCPWAAPGLVDVLFICTVPPRTQSVCFGDSGGGLIAGSPPVLVGVLNSVEGGSAGEPDACVPGASAGWTNLASPLHSFIDGRSSSGRTPPPTPPPARPPAPPPAARPSFTLEASRAARVSRRGVITLRVKASGGSGVIAGTLTVIRKRVVGRTVLRVRSGALATVRVRLNTRGRSALRGKRLVRFTVRLQAAGGLPTTAPILVLGRRRR